MAHSFIKNKILLSFIIYLFVCFSYTNAFPTYNFKQLSIEHGLSQSTVTCAYKDYKGIMWIGTTMGLNRFDQYDLKNYLHEGDTTSSLPDNHICFIAEDAQNNLWIGTLIGLTYYNRNDDNFTTLQLDDAPIQARTATVVEDGVIFAGTQLWKYDYKAKK